ncbi:hypothetical protein C3L33_17150, partial [Rhododendron williamsianum]
MKFLVKQQHEVDSGRVPEELIKYPSADLSGASETRYIAMYEYTSDIDEPTHLYLNGKSYEKPVTETPKVGTTETELVDLDEFKECMTKMNDAIKCQISKYARGKRMSVPAHEKGWKNVYKMTPGFVTKILLRCSKGHGFNFYEEEVQSLIDRLDKDG